MPGYADWRVCLRDVECPAAIVDLDALDRNIEKVRRAVETSGKTMRVASKSVRVPALLRRILEKGGPTFRGLLCYSAAEAEFLRQEGFTDLVVAYPTLDAPAPGIARMIDRPQTGDVWIDVDASFRLGPLHLGVHRSPIHDESSFRSLVRTVKSGLKGVMAYEAHIAGLGDKSPFRPFYSLLVSLLKPFFRRQILARRRMVRRVLVEEGFPSIPINGGGSGSLAFTLGDPSVTEVTAGSGFLQSHLFDYYAGNLAEPALFFALRVTRVPGPGWVTCQSGGFIASGGTGPDKAPVVYLPAGVSPTSDEGFGEVQTPLRVHGETKLAEGDVVLFRPAKAGEIAERFNEYCLVQGGKVVSRVPTYRGLGKAFY